MSDIHSPIHYRPEIDGLRAFAVLAVILFHAFPSLLAGGFIGVDIFFVISGYLISKIILKETALGKFTFTSFYQRRIRRIYPALILVVTVTAIIGWFSLFPDEFAQLFKHISLTTLFIANFGFWQEAGYFDNMAETKPLLHFWSLGVEEQFYIVWPLLLLFLLRKFPARFGTGLIVFSILSFICNIALMAEQKEAAFFLPFGRWWELAAGGLLAYAETKNAHPARYLADKYNINLKKISIEDVLSASGFILIIASSLTFREHFDFPGFWALLPVLGSVLIIAAGQESRINQFLLGNRLAVGIGLISYPLYLWHWPIFSYLHILKLASTETLCAGIALTFILATATYHLIEKPVRTKPASRYSAALLLASAICLVIGLLGWQGVLKPRLNFPEIHKYLAAKRDWNYPPPSAIEEKFGDLIAYKLKGAYATETLYIGDSNMEQYAPRIEYLASSNPNAQSAVFLTHGGCLPLPNLINKNKKNCTDLMKTAQDYIDHNRVTRIVIAGRWDNNLSSDDATYFYLFPDGSMSSLNKDNARKAALGSLKNFIKRQQEKDIEVYILHNIPVIPAELYDINIGRLNLVLSMVDPRSYSFYDIYNKAESVDLKIRNYIDVVVQDSGAKLIDPIAFFCGETTCRLADEEFPRFYKDAGHLAASFVKERVTYLDETVLLKKEK